LDSTLRFYQNQTFFHCSSRKFFLHRDHQRVSEHDVVERSISFPRSQYFWIDFHITDKNRKQNHHWKMIWTKQDGGLKPLVQVWWFISKIHKAPKTHSFIICLNMLACSNLKRSLELFVKITNPTSSLMQKAENIAGHTSKIENIFPSVSSLNRKHSV